MFTTHDKANLVTGIRQLPQAPNKLPSLNNDLDKPAVLILDVMCDVKALKKEPGTTKVKDLKRQFLKRISKNVTKASYVRVFLLVQTRAVPGKKRGRRGEIAK